jgi:Fe2+ or Zn2+ uptake regulation protein
MTIERYGPTFEVSCDSCPHTFDTDECEFAAAVRAVKEEGWRISKVGGEWIHTCPSCQETEKNDWDE